MARQVGQLYRVARSVLVPLLRLGWRLEVSGAEHVPATGGAIMAPNHTSVIDSFFLPTVLDRRITYVGKAEYLDDWKTRHLFPALGMIPIDRTGGDAARAALDAAASVLEAGELFGIYPEGTRSRTGVLHKGHTGAARLARRTGCPIVPVGLVGTAAVQPPDAKLPRPFRSVQIRMGEPLWADPDTDPADPRVHRRLTDRLMFEIAALSGQRYVDAYATRTPVDAGEVPGDGTLERRRSSADVLADSAA